MKAVPLDSGCLTVSPDPGCLAVSPDSECLTVSPDPGYLTLQKVFIYATINIIEIPWLIFLEITEIPVWMVPDIQEYFL